MKLWLFVSSNYVTALKQRSSKTIIKTWYGCRYLREKRKEKEHFQDVVSSVMH